MPFVGCAAAHARRQIEAAARWWLANRDKAPELFVNDLDAAHMLLAVEPGAGTGFPTPRYPGARRLLMGRTRYHVYYTVHAEEEIELIRAIWHASRGRVPALR